MLHVSETIRDQCSIPTIKEIRMSDTFPQMHEYVADTRFVWSAASNATVKCIYSRQSTLTCNVFYRLTTIR